VLTGTRKKAQPCWLYSVEGAGEERIGSKKRWDLVRQCQKKSTNCAKEKPVVKTPPSFPSMWGKKSGKTGKDGAVSRLGFSETLVTGGLA